jgi:hypothetical protein
VRTNRSFLFRKITKTVALPPEIKAIKAMIHRNPNTARNGGPNIVNSVKMMKSQASAPTKVTPKNRLVGYFISPDATNNAVRLPRTRRLKIRAQPPKRRNHSEAASIFSRATKARIQRDSKALAPPIFTIR